MNWAAGICCHCREKNAFSCSRFARVPGREHRQRAEQANPRPGRAGLALRAVQPGQLVGAGRGEHVPLPADQLSDHRVVQGERGDQLRVVPGEAAASSSVTTTGGWALRSRSCWASSTIASTACCWDGVVAVR